MLDKRKVVIIGAGHVGSHVAMALCFQGTCDEIVLIDRDREKAVSNSYDVADACLFLPSTTYVRAGDYADCRDADVIVISVGMPRKPGQTRLDLLDDSIVMIRDVISHLREVQVSGIVISITNPADVVGDYLRRHLQLPRERCFSTGTSLDTARLRRTLSEMSGMDRKSVSACALGEHGNSSMVAFSSVTLGGVSMRRLKEADPDACAQLREDVILERTRNIGNDIINGKGSTEFGIGAACADMIRAIFHDEKRVIPASVCLEGEYGLSGVACGVPCVIGRGGIEKIVELPLDAEERELLARSCDVIRQYSERAESV